MDGLHGELGPGRGMERRKSLPLYPCSLWSQGVWHGSPPFCACSKAGTDLSRRIGATVGQHMECLFTYPCDCFSGPLENSSSHFGVTVALGPTEAQDWAPNALYVKPLPCSINVKCYICMLQVLATTPNTNDNRTPHFVAI